MTIARSGFATVIGRPNVGKSTLVNAMVGDKITITSRRPNTTRIGVRGIVHRGDAEVVFVDTPGLHRPRSPLGSRLNNLARVSLEDADVVIAVVDATAALGPGDRMVLEQVTRLGESASALVAVNKIDRAGAGDVLSRLASVASALEQSTGVVVGASWSPAGPELFPVSARSGEGVPDLLDAVVRRLPPGPAMYPEDMTTDLPPELRIAEAVREQLLARVRDELPHSIACRVTDRTDRYVRCEIVVERESQKAIVIGRRGAMLEEVGKAVRRRLPPGTYLDLVVRVESHWPRRPDALDRLGY
jgi:GTPase